MLEVADALVGKWRRNEGKDLDVVADMTRLTLDTIGITGFDYRFDSFGTDEVHPFLQALADSLTRGHGAAEAAAVRHRDAAPAESDLRGERAGHALARRGGHPRAPRGWGR